MNFWFGETDERFGLWLGMQARKNIYSSSSAVTASLK